MSHNSKFFSLMRSLSVDELLGFQRFLHKYHGGEATPLKVFTYCKRFHDPKIDADKIDLAGIYRNLYKSEMGSEEKERKKILNPLSDLGIWLKEFLLAEKMRNESWVSKMVWLGILQERGLHRECSKLASDIHEAQPKTLPDTVACLQQIVTGLYYKRHLVQHKAKPDYETLIDCAASIKQSADILSLKMACEILNHQKIRPNQSAKIQVSHVQPLMLLYQKIYVLLDTGNEEEYPRVVSFLNEHLEYLGENEVLVCTRLLHNFAAPKVRSAKVGVWGKQIHELDKILLKKGLYTLDGMMSTASFCNIVNAACAAKETEWAKGFILDNRQLLPEDAREESIKLANATIAFEEKNFKNVLALVKDPQLKDIQNMGRAKSLKLRALYELNSKDDTIEDLCVSFKIYLKRNREEQPGFVDAILAFLGLFIKLYQKKLTKQLLLKEIEATPNLYFYQWLLDKLDGYQGGNAN